MQNADIIKNEMKYVGKYIMGLIWIINHFSLPFGSGIIIIYVERSLSSMKWFKKKFLVWLYNGEKIQVHWVIFFVFLLEESSYTHLDYGETSV